MAHDSAPPAAPGLDDSGPVKFALVSPSEATLTPDERETAADSWPVRVHFRTTADFARFVGRGSVDAGDVSAASNAANRRAPSDAPSLDGSGRRRRRPRAAPSDRNLVTVAEFAHHVSIAESTVFELLKRGLPSTKTKGLGRRILRGQAEAWLIAGGAERSRAARKFAKANGGGRG